jgi:uncharacterized protein (DUF924 family)
VRHYADPAGNGGVFLRHKRVGITIGAMSTPEQKIQSAAQIVDFWFSDAVSKRWFRSTKAFDDELRDRFEATVQAALRGELDDWLSSSTGVLALVILLDQLPLNIYRGTAESFAGEARSREAATVAIEHGWDQQLPSQQRAFLYLPFMHSEAVADQDRAVALFHAAGLEGNLRWAKHHREIVRRFGRFPHRNRILGRESTAEEEAWLASDEAFRG